MFLGIEIGGTKLQLAIGAGDGTPLVEFTRAEIHREDEAGGILRQIETIGRDLIARHRPTAIGIGFGGPVDADEGRTITSHQVEGWADFALAAWCRETFGVPAAIANDADSAGLAEALFGAGRGHRVVFYITVGSGIGGALVTDGRIYSGGRGIAAEIGHLRPGLDAADPRSTVESHASGFGIAAAGQAWLRNADAHSGGKGDSPHDHGYMVPAERPEGCCAQMGTVLFSPAAAVDLLARCNGRVKQLSGRMVVDAAAAGNLAAQGILAHAHETLGWAVAQMITLLAPQIVVIGGGVPLAGETLFFAPLRRAVARYVFPPLAKSYAIVPAALGEEVVVHGALAVARFDREKNHSA
jgi:glucokinase